MAKPIQNLAKVLKWPLDLCDERGSLRPFTSVQAPLFYLSSLKHPVFDQFLMLFFVRNCLLFPAIFVLFCGIFYFIQDVHVNLSDIIIRIIP